MVETLIRDREESDVEVNRWKRAVLWNRSGEKHGHI